MGTEPSRGRHDLRDKERRRCNPQQRVTVTGRRTSSVGATNPGAPPGTSLNGHHTTSSLTVGDQFNFRQP